MVLKQRFILSFDRPNFLHLKFSAINYLPFGCNCVFPSWLPLYKVSLALLLLSIQVLQTRLLIGLLVLLAAGVVAKSFNFFSSYVGCSLGCHPLSLVRFLPTTLVLYRPFSRPNLVIGKLFVCGALFAPSALAQVPIEGVLVGLMLFGGFVCWLWLLSSPLRVTFLVPGGLSPWPRFLGLWPLLYCVGHFCPPFMKRLAPIFEKNISTFQVAWISSFSNFDPFLQFYIASKSLQSTLKDI